jgi:cobalamin biosynthesis Co2+ chelatase CbiK
VVCVVEGLGQLEEIQALFVQHAKAAIDSVQ